MVIYPVVRFPNDPNAQNEHDRYDNPIPSRSFILDYLHKQKSLVKLIDLERDLGLTNKEDRLALKRRLLAMRRDGQIFYNRKQRVGLIEKAQLHKAKVIAHRDGYGFLNLDNHTNDIFISSKQMQSLLSGDSVLATIDSEDSRGRVQANVVEILERKYLTIVGRLYFEKGIAWLCPQAKDIYQDILLVPDKMLAENENCLVQARILPSEKLNQPLIAEVVTILGSYQDPGVEIEATILNYQIKDVFSNEIKKYIQSMSEEIPQQEYTKCQDLRSKDFVTIDGETAQDYDDALYCEVLANGNYRLWVAIADVSYYVLPNSVLDLEALERGTSVYFPGKVVPMLPTKISNNLCSLMPNKDRLTLVCECDINSDGVVIKETFYRAIIQSKARLTYTEVAALLDGMDYDLLQKRSVLLPYLVNLYQLYGLLYKQRKKRGAIDFNTVESKIVFEDNKKIAEIIPVHRNDAHRIVEECMLCANVSAAKFLTNNKLLGLYRVHESPSTEKLSAVREFLQTLGLSLSGGSSPCAQDYMQLISSISERDDAQLIETILLRSLSQANYSPKNQGHFGLAYEQYTHFTSPIRRYPDLITHRILIDFLAAKKQQITDKNQMISLGENCSMTERRAEQASRDVEYWLKCEYIQHKLGEIFPGIITSVVSFGLFVELKDLFVEGLVHISCLDSDYYHFNKVTHALVGEHTQKQYQIGDSLLVRVVRVDLDDRKIDFDLPRS